MAMHLPRKTQLIYPLEDSHNIHSSKRKRKILLCFIPAEQKQKNYSNIFSKTELLFCKTCTLNTNIINCFSALTGA